jgi:lysophospholipase L1-like esterase
MKKLLILTNIVTLSLLLLLFYRHYGITYALMLGLRKPTPVNYANNPYYTERKDHFSGIGSKGRIVMFGNSLVYRMTWSELLNRCDVVNHGVSSDITRGMVSRLQDVITSEPEIVFIEGGINDIAAGIPNDTIIANLMTIVTTLQLMDIVPIVNEICYVGENYPNGDGINREAAEINLRLRELAASMKFNTIDLNKTMSNGSYLLPEYALSDGIHFTIDGYKVWKNEIERHITF